MLTTTPEVCRVISPNDLMWQGGQSWYFDVGQSALRMIELALAASYRESLDTILDLGCGHGRVGRYLRAQFPVARITFCDTVPDAADFCAEHFEGRALHSKPELTEADLGGPYDLIWVGSLFTHVDHTTTIRWLNHACAALAPGGVLVSTFHGLWTQSLHYNTPFLSDDRWASTLAIYNRTGYGFSPFDCRADGHEGNGAWGISLTDPKHVIELAMKIPGTRICGFVERGWADNHDVLMLSKNDRSA